MAANSHKFSSERIHMSEEKGSVHEVKSWTFLFQALVSGLKKHDIRDMTERDYKVGDTLVLKEFDQTSGKFTGREQKAKITYITSSMTPCAFSSAVLKKEFGILSLELID